MLPELDACGGHFGKTADCDWCYHYHVQEAAPFTFGCYGPVFGTDGNQKLVTLAECRALYDECGNGDALTLTLQEGDIEYDPW